MAGMRVFLTLKVVRTGCRIRVEAVVVPDDGDGFREGLNPSYDLLPDRLSEARRANH